MDAINLLRRTTYLASVPFAARWWIYYRNAHVPSGQPDDSDKASPVLQPITGYSNDAIGKPTKRAIDNYAKFLANRNVPFLVVGHGDSEVIIDIVRFCKEREIPTLHVMVPEALKLVGDGHFNARGNQRIAELIYRQIRG
jgi:hypothetical protein